MISVKEFYERWEDTESKLIDMTVYPLLVGNTAERFLGQLYMMKRAVDAKVRKALLTPDSEFKGINTRKFGIVTFERIADFVERRYVSASEKSLGSYMTIKGREEDLNWFRQRGYLPKVK